MKIAMQLTQKLLRMLLALLSTSAELESSQGEGTAWSLTLIVRSLSGNWDMVDDRTYLNLRMYQSIVRA